MNMDTRTVNVYKNSEYLGKAWGDLPDEVTECCVVFALEDLDRGVGLLVGWTFRLMPVSALGHRLMPVRALCEKTLDPSGRLGAMYLTTR